MNSKDGMNYAPTGKPVPVVGPGEFVIAAAALDHGHIYGMCNGLIEAGATLKWVYDRDPAKVAQFQKTYPGVRAARSEEEILSDPEVKLVCGAAVTSSGRGADIPFCPSTRNSRAPGCASGATATVTSMLWFSDGEACSGLRRI